MIYPAVYNMTIEQRADFYRSFTLSQADGTELDLTGYALNASLWTERRRKLTDFTLTWIDQAAGQFALSLTDAQTTLLSGSAVWDLLVEDPDGLKDYWLRGDVLIEQGFTV